jgi:transcriptional regulator with XRE-family HTH domain
VSRSRRRIAARALKPGDSGYRRSLFDQARARRQMRSYEACAEIGISLSHLMRLLRDNHHDPRRPPPALAQRIAAFCEVPVSEIFPDVVSS